MNESSAARVEEGFCLRWWAGWFGYVCVKGLSIGGRLLLAGEWVNRRCTGGGRRTSGHKSADAVGTDDFRLPTCRHIKISSRTVPMREI